MHFSGHGYCTCLFTIKVSKDHPDTIYILSSFVYQQSILLLMTEADHPRQEGDSSSCQSAHWHKESECSGGSHS